MNLDFDLDNNEIKNTIVANKENSLTDSNDSKTQSIENIDVGTQFIRNCNKIVLFFETAVRNKTIDNIINQLLKDLESKDISAIFQLGIYYEYIKFDRAKMNKYLLMAVEKEDLNSIHRLGKYYEIYEGDEKTALKYYLIAADKGHPISMCSAARYYERLKVEDNNIIKYYKMAIEKGYDVAISCLGSYYRNIKNFTEMEKYYLMGVEKKCSNCMYHYGYYFKYDKKDYVNMKKYCLMAIENGDYHSMFMLGQYYEIEGNNYEEMKKYYIMAMRRGDCDAAARRMFDYHKYKNKYTECLEIFEELMEEMIDDDNRKFIYNKLEEYCSEMFDRYGCDIKRLIRDKIRFKKDLAKANETIEELKARPGGPEYDAAKKRFELMQISNINL